MKHIGIEAMLTWAYGRELPKVAAARRAAGVAPTVLGVGQAWTRVSDACDLGTVVDVNRYGCVPVDGDEGEPHPDALRLGDIVEAVSRDGEIVWPDGYAPIEDWGDVSPLVGGHVDLARARLFREARGDEGGGLREPIADLVRRCAVLGAPTGWDGARPEERETVGREGNPEWFRRVRAVSRWNDDGEAIAWGEVEVDGFDAKRRRPFPDAYRKIELAPDPTETLVARMRWQIWRAALDMIADACVGAFAEHVAMPSMLPYGPWVAGEARGVERRVLADGRVVVGPGREARVIGSDDTCAVGSIVKKRLREARSDRRKGIDSDRMS